MNKSDLRNLILEEMQILEACCAVKLGKKPCTGCMSGSPCGGKMSDIKSLDGSRPSAVAHKGHDREGRMTKGNLYHMMKYASKVYEMIDDDDELPEWLQNKVARAVEKMSSVYHYMDNHVNQPDSIVHLVDAD